MSKATDPTTIDQDWAPAPKRRLRIVAARVLATAIVALLLFSAPAYVQTAPWDELGLALGFLAVIVSAFGRVWTAHFIAGRKNQTVVREGPYSICRNPLYLFSFFAVIGVSLAAQSLLIGALLMVAFVLTHYPTILREEGFLLDRFGDEFRHYMDTTPRWIPALGAYQKSEEMQVNTRAFERALLDCTLIILAFGGVVLIDWLQAAGWLPVLIRVY